MPLAMLAASSSPDLSSLTDNLRALASRGELRRYRRGTLLIHEGDLGDTMFIVLAGRLRAFSSGDNGREITFGVYGCGEVLGEMSLDGGRRSASVITLEPSTCAVVTRTTLEGFMAEHPKFAFELLGTVIWRARAAMTSARHLALSDTYGRLKLLLESLAGPRLPGGCSVVVERLTHREMSNRVGCSREMVSRLMKDLERGGYLQTGAAGLMLTRTLPARW